MAAHSVIAVSHDVIYFNDISVLITGMFGLCRYTVMFISTSVLLL